MPRRRESLSPTTGRRSRSYRSPSFSLDATCGRSASRSRVVLEVEACAGQRIHFELDLGRDECRARDSRLECGRVEKCSQYDGADFGLRRTLAQRYCFGVRDRACALRTHDETRWQSKLDQRLDELIARLADERRGRVDRRHELLHFTTTKHNPPITVPRTRSIPKHRNWTVSKRDASCPRVHEQMLMWMQRMTIAPCAVMFW